MKKKTTKKKIKRKPLSKGGPWLQVGKKIHPFGKPIEMHWFDLRMWVAVSYKTQVGLTREGGIGFGKSKVDDITIFYQDKKHTGMFHLDKDTARKLFETLKMFYDEDKKGYVKKTYSGVTLTKHRKYK